jgi:Zn finger protein HypA/HybF involved in hydrogenase expression
MGWSDMECPNCNVDVDTTLMNIEVNAEEDGVEINFKCPWCKSEQYAVITMDMFAPID